MAPNRKNVTLLAPQIANLKVVQPKESNYQPQQQQSVVDSASYWDWPSQESSEPASEIVSTDRIVANLIEESSRNQDKSTTLSTTYTNASSDDYWAEAEHDAVEEPSLKVSSASTTSTSKPQHEQPEQINSDDYWAEASYGKSSNDEYWNTKAVVPPLPKAPVETIRNPAVNPSYSAAYWQERTHDKGTAPTNSDDYWAEAKPSASADGDYWDEASFAQTRSDDYWNWPSIPV